MNPAARQYLFGRDKLPHGWSYPLKRTVLDSALQAAGATRVFSVRYSYGAGEQRDRPLSVQFDSDEPRRFDAGTVSITVYAVPSTDCRSVTEELESKLPTVCDWITRTETAPDGWRMTPHELAVEFRDGQARIVEPR